MTRTRLVTCLIVTLTAAPALAGRGGSGAALRAAIDSGSIDAISAELERTEHLVCGSCVHAVRPLVDHPDTRVRRVAAWWLARRGLRGDLFVEMALRLAQPDSRKAEAAADVLGGLRNLKAIEPLGAALGNPIFDAPARAAMAGALGRIGDPAALPALIAGARAPEALVRAAAVAAMRELRDARLDVPLLAERLADPDEAVRVEAVYTLGASRGVGLDSAARARASHALAGVVAGDGSARVRRKAVWALRELTP